MMKFQITEKIRVNALAGAIGGFVSWIIIEPFYNEGKVPIINVFIGMAIFFSIVGALIGMALAVVESLTQRSFQRAIREGVVGLGVGLIGGAIGGIIGQGVYSLILTTGGKDIRSAGILTIIIARALGWTALGGLIGTIQGMTIRSKKKIRNGVIGGLIGGFIGGILFDLIASIFHTGLVSRMLAITLLGALIGAFIGIVEELLKESWLKVIKGRFEGKEYILYKPVTILGRDEKSDIGLFGDPSISGRHAEIRIEDKKYLLSNISSASGTFVNEVAITKHTLKDGDRIQIGNILLLYREKVRKDREGHPTLVTSKPSIVEVPREAVSERTAVKMQEGRVGRSYLLAQGIISAIGKVQLTKEVTILGRDKTNDIVIDQDSISRRHAQIKKEGNQYMIYDLNSTNGTFIDGVKVMHSIVRDGQVIKLGECMFVFKEE